ncbi:hypothetical protein KEJ34_05575 [Candidatus Bathyarchaeota archaeon]|nr:hypothetical protein [Candidatus Bathyarchaeota archaeon]
MFKRCPGVRNLIEPQITFRKCPFCGEEMEFFEYETHLECPRCGEIVYREPTETCLSWCEYADKCIADLENRGVISRIRAEELRKFIGKRR